MKFRESELLTTLRQVDSKGRETGFIPQTCHMSLVPLHRGLRNIPSTIYSTLIPMIDDEVTDKRKTQKFSLPSCIRHTTPMKFSTTHSINLIEDYGEFCVRNNITR